MPRPIEEQEAEHGERMLEVRVRFWTNDIADDGKIAPRHAWSAGVVRMATNRAHGIRGSKPVKFNSLLEMPAAIERLLIQEGITVHVAKKMAKYLD